MAEGAVSPSRNSFDVTTQNLDIDTFGVGVLRRPEITLPVNWAFGDTSHQRLLSSIKAGSLDGFRTRFPDGTSVTIFSGYVTNVAVSSPVDGVQRANITLRPSGRMMINGVVYG
jgi:hypothetical protein